MLGYLVMLEDYKNQLKKLTDRIERLQGYL